MPGLDHVRAVLFDLDGTLVDSLDDITDHLNAALAERGLPTHPRERVRTWVGHGAASLVAHAVPDAALAADVLARFRASYAAAPVVRTRVFAGLDRALDALAASRKLAIISNKPHDLTVQIAEDLLAHWQFAPVLGHRPGRPLKPDPEAVLAIARELAIDPAACALVGDSAVDVATARAAGMTSVAVTWGLCEAAELVAAAPDHLVDAPGRLAALFA